MTGKLRDDWSWEDIAFAGWRSAVDARLLHVYAITIDEAGIDEDRLISHWEMKRSPYEFVEWFGVKYGLTSRDEVKWTGFTMSL